MIDFKKDKILLGQMLINSNVITQNQLESALVKQKEMGDLLGKILLELGYIDQEATLLPFLAQQYKTTYAMLSVTPISMDAVNRITFKTAEKYEVMPIELKGDYLTLATTRPYDFILLDELRMLTDCQINPVMATQTDIKVAIKKYYAVGSDVVEDLVEKRKNDGFVHGFDNVNHSGHEAQEFNTDTTLINFLDKIFFQAYNDRATDIHIEPQEKRLSIRFRIDGILYDIKVPESLIYLKDAINSRIKIMSNLDISEKRLPQDGRFRVNLNEIKLDFRVSFIPTAYGESVVLRILNSTRLYNFDELDLTVQERSILTDLISRPNGIIFVTGPTGSGKTTTLYSALSKINTIDKKIITIEDPVEYQIPGVSQIQINSGINLTFSRGLRSILRQDPNVIMVGEVRDAETAEIAIQVALTGHLIFSTLHTNDAASGATRLINMGIEPYLISSTVQCFIAQRLVRINCPNCKVEHKLSLELVKKFDPDAKEEIISYKGIGCDHCNQTGYIGRTGIFEFLMLNDEINELILQRASASEIKAKARSLGMKTLRDSGWEKIKSGMTTTDEVIRVTQERTRSKNFNN